MNAFINFEFKQVTLSIAEVATNDTVVLQEQFAENYSGLKRSAFAAPTELHHIFSVLFAKTKGLRISKLYINVPAGVCEVTQSMVSIPLGRVKISKSHVRSLLDSVTLSEGDNFAISKTAAFFRVDNAQPCINPMGSVGTTLSACVSMISIPQKFVDVVRSATANVVPVIEFIPTPLSVALYAATPDARDATCVIIQAETHTTTAFVVCGEGLVALSTIDVGFIHIIRDLAKVMNISEQDAAELVPHVVLGIRDDSLYEFAEKTYKSTLVNEIIESRLEELVEKILTTITKIDKSLLDKTIYFCGEVDTLKGARNFLAREIGSNLLPLRDPKLFTCHFSEMITRAAAKFADEVQK